MTKYFIKSLKRQNQRYLNERTAILQDLILDAEAGKRRPTAAHLILGRTPPATLSSPNENSHKHTLRASCGCCLKRSRQLVPRPYEHSLGMASFLPSRLLNAHPLNMFQTPSKCSLQSAKAVAIFRVFSERVDRLPKLDN